MHLKGRMARVDIEGSLRPLSYPDHDHRHDASH